MSSSEGADHRYCVIEHELTHAVDCGQHIRPSAPRGHTGGSSEPTHYSSWTECRAFCMQLVCLLGLLEDARIPAPHRLHLGGSLKSLCGPGMGMPPFHLAPGVE